MKRYIKGILIACLMIQGQLIFAVNGDVDGDLDTTFGIGGQITLNIQDPPFEASDFANALVIRHDGRIVAGGSCADPEGGDGRGFALAILEPDGSEVCTNCLDPRNPGSFDSINGLAVQPDNKVVAVGVSGQTAGDMFIVARYNKDCTLDTSFGTNGVTEVPFPNATNAVARAVAFKRDGRIVVVGEAQDAQGGGPFYAVAVLNPDGTLDNSFAGGAGRRVYDMVAPDGNPMNINASSSARAVAIQSIGTDDNIILAGTGKQGTNTFQVVRITCNGDLDTTFGTFLSGAEQIVFNADENEVANGVDVRKDGRIVAVGTSTLTQDTDEVVVIAQLLVNGTPDPAFDGDGKVTFQPINLSVRGNALCIQNDEKTLIAGRSFDITSTIITSHDFLLARFNANGSLDTATFNPNNGFLTTIFGDDSVANAIALQCDGKIVAAGTVESDPEQFALARYLNENGNDEVIVEPTITQPTNLGNCNTPQPTFSGAAQNPANITVYIDGQEAGRGITQGTANTWEFTPPAPLATGSHTVQMVAEYKSGNQNCVTDPLCCGVCLGCQSCLSEALRPKYCPSCVDFPIC